MIGWRLIYEPAEFISANTKSIGHYVRIFFNIDFVSCGKDEHVGPALITLQKH